METVEKLPVQIGVIALEKEIFLSSKFRATTMRNYVTCMKLINFITTDKFAQIKLKLNMPKKSVFVKVSFERPNCKLHSFWNGIWSFF